MLAIAGSAWFPSQDGAVGARAGRDLEGADPPGFPVACVVGVKGAMLAVCLAALVVTSRLAALRSGVDPADAAKSDGLPAE